MGFSGSSADPCHTGLTSSGFAPLLTPQVAIPPTYHFPVELPASASMFRDLLLTYSEYLYSKVFGLLRLSSVLPQPLDPQFSGLHGL